MHTRFQNAFLETSVIGAGTWIQWMYTFRSTISNKAYFHV
jgi:hypothetical protein